MERTPLDTYDILPPDMVNYLRHNGWHFNKPMCEWAVKNMRKKSTATGKMERITPWSKEKVDEMMKAHGVQLENATGQDYVYVANMAKADLFESSLQSEQQVAQYIKDVVDDADQRDGFILNRFYADCCHAGLPIPWSEVL